MRGLHCGQLLKESQRAKGAAVKHTRTKERGKVTTPSQRDGALQSKTLHQLGVSETQSSRWQRMAGGFWLLT
jgi:hypothetical protein